MSAEVRPRVSGYRLLGVGLCCAWLESGGVLLARAPSSACGWGAAAAGLSHGGGSLGRARCMFVSSCTLWLCSSLLRRLQRIQAAGIWMEACRDICAHQGVPVQSFRPAGVEQSARMCGSINGSSAQSSPHTPLGNDPGHNGTPHRQGRCNRSLTWCGGAGWMTWWGQSWCPPTS